MSKHFRFEDLKIWQKAVSITNRLFEISVELEKKGFYRYAEQIRASGLSICNNIAEGSGSQKNRNFGRYLDYSRGSVFESANVVIILNLQNLISLETKNELYTELEELSRMITGFQKAL